MELKQDYYLNILIEVKKDELIKLTSIQLFSQNNIKVILDDSSNE